MKSESELKTAVDRVLRDAAKAGDAYWDVRARGLDALANALLGECPVEPMPRWREAALRRRVAKTGALMG